MSTGGTRGIDDWTGQWRWNVETAQFAHLAWKEQLQEVEVSGDRLVIRTEQTFADDRQRRWTFDGAFDGVPRPVTWDDTGEVLVEIAFIRLDIGVGADAYRSPNGRAAGAEHFIVAENNVKVYGSANHTTGGFAAYFEEWDRITE